jgi:hypothetical protein
MKKLLRNASLLTLLLTSCVVSGFSQTLAYAGQKQPVVEQKMPVQRTSTLMEKPVNR